VLAAELGIAHPRGVSREVVGLDANSLDDFGGGGNEGMKGAYQLFDFPLVEQAARVDLPPRFLLPLVVGMQPAHQFHTCGRA